MMTDPKEEFKSSLAERLKEAGKRNMAITSPGDTGRDEAMENLAGAFADPVGDYVDERAAAAGAGVVSSDGTVDVAARVVDDRAYSDLSVARAVEAAVAAEAVERQIADEEILNGIVPQVRADWAETDPAKKSFIENKMAAISDAEIEALED